MPEIVVLSHEGRGGFCEIVADFNQSNLRIARLIGRCEGGPWNVYLISQGDEWRVEGIVGPVEVERAVAGQQWAFTLDADGAMISPISMAVY